MDIPLLSDEQKRAVISILNDDINTVLRGATDKNSYGFVEKVRLDMSEITGSKKYTTEGHIDREMMAALKLYAAGLFCSFEEIERTRSMTPEEMWRIEEEYFASSDQIIEFTGGYSSELELFALSRRSETGRAYGGSLRAGLVYDGTFGNITDSLDKVWHSRKGVESQLSIISTFESLRVAAESESYAARMETAISNKLDTIASDSQTSPLIRLYAERTLEKASPQYYDLYDFPIKEQRELVALYEAEQKQAAREQEILHDTFEGFPEDSQLYRIAKDACVSIDQGDLGWLVTLDNRQADLHRPEARENSLNLDTTDIELLKAAHDPVLLETVELETGLDMRMLSLDAQVRFFRFMAESDAEQYERLCSVLARFDDERTTVAETFLATEFGEDFGHRILTIAEQATPEQSQRIFTLLEEYRDNVVKYSEFFANFDSELTDATKRAMNERLSDLIVVAEKVARDGAFTVDVAPHRKNAEYQHDGKFDVTISSIDEVIETMELLATSLDQVVKISTSADIDITRTVKNESEVGYQIYRFSHPEFGDMLLHIRAEGSGRYDKGFEYGSYDGVEATISFVVNPTPPHRLRSDKDPRGVSFRFDREGRAPGELPNSETRHPTNKKGMMSLDVSSIMGSPDTAAVKIGRLVVAGNLLRAEELNQEGSLHYNTNYFDQQKMGSSGGFKALVEYVKQMVELRMHLRQRNKLSRGALQRLND